MIVEEDLCFGVWEEGGKGMSIVHKHTHNKQLQSEYILNT